MKRTGCPSAMRRLAAAAARQVLPVPWPPVSSSEPDPAPRRRPAPHAAQRRSGRSLQGRRPGHCRGQRLEGDGVQHAEVAVALQARKAVRFALLHLAEAGESAPEVRVADGHVTAHPALTSAGRAYISIGGLGVELLHPLRNVGDVREVPLL